MNAPLPCSSCMCMRPIYGVDVFAFRGAGSSFVTHRRAPPRRAAQVSKLTYGFKVMMAAMKMSVTSFSVLVFFMLILVILSSSLMYMVEGTDPPHPMQARPDLFATIPDCMWWSIVTMTTVGYGDAVPASPAGKVVATFTMCLGLLAIALPVTVLGSNFTKVMDMFEEELSMVEYEESEDTGTNVSEDELRFFLYSKRQQGLVCETFSRQTTLQVMRQYDKSSKGERAAAVGRYAGRAAPADDGAHTWHLAACISSARGGLCAPSPPP